MGDFTISGAVRPAMIPRLGVSSLTVRWRERSPHVETDPRDAELTLSWQDSLSEPISGALPTTYRPPFLASHDAALTWLRYHIFQPGALVDGDDSFPSGPSDVDY